MMDMREISIRAVDLEVVAAARLPEFPALILGDYCQLNSGSPGLMVVDADVDAVTVSWRRDGRVFERLIPRACVRRAPAPRTV